MQPSFERFSHDTATRFAQQFSIGAVPIPGDERPQYANPALCKPLGVSGFLVPGRRWEYNAKTVTVTARLVLFDCDGDRFYDGSAAFSEPRNEAMIVGAQIDAASSRAIDRALATFATFMSGHRVLWSRLLATGSLRVASPAPTVSPSP